MGVAKSNHRRSPEPKRHTPARRRVNGASRSLNAKPLNFTIDSDFAQQREVQAQILQRVQECGFDKDSSFAIHVALEEALINAIKHGNKLDKSKKVHVQAKIDARKAEITIEDEGPGFVREAVPDPTAEENLCKCSGRGILLIESYMTSVEYSKQGRRVKMVKLNEHKQEG
jgi:serine/threonine-protein kinase RsbW